MNSLQLLYQPRAAVLLLVWCSILEMGQGLETWDSPLSVSMKADPLEEENEFAVTLTVRSNVDKCMVVKISIADNSSVEYLSAHASYTACICDTNNFFWDIHAFENTVLQGKAEVVANENICPEGEILYDKIGSTELASVEITVKNY